MNFGCFALHKCFALVYTPLHTKPRAVVAEW